jgi:hypothetical protein
MRAPVWEHPTVRPGRNTRPRRGIASRRRTSVVLACGSILLVPALSAGPVRADWPESGRAVSTAAADQNASRVCPDGADGAIVTWQDDGPGSVDVFAHHVLSSGELDPAWPVNGRALLSDPAALAGSAAGQTFPVIVPDGTGGAVVAWQDGRSSASGVDLYAQHVLASGRVDAGWPANGAALCTAPGTQNNLVAVPDGAGGLIAAWMDGRSATSDVDIYAQHVLASGAIDASWPVDGAALCTAPGRQAIPRIAGDGAGGAIVTWYDFRSSAITGVDIYAQHVLSSGMVDPAWPGNGLAVCTAAGGQLDPQIVADRGGAIITWVDTRDPLGDIYAHHVLITGAVDSAWPVNGLAVCTDPAEQIRPIIVSDGAGGAIVDWEDARGGFHHNMFAQHVLATGRIDSAWPVNGTALSTRPTEQNAAVIVQDGAGGAIVAWQDGFDIFAQHLLATGALDAALSSNGRPVIALPGIEEEPGMVAAGPGRAIVTWTDLRSGLTSDIYAQEFRATATTGVGDPAPAREVTFGPPSPNPARGPTTLRFILPRESRPNLSIYDVTGRRVRRLSSRAQDAGRHAIAWDLRDDVGRGVVAGLYVARLEVEGRILTRKITVLN